MLTDLAGWQPDKLAKKIGLGDNSVKYDEIRVRPDSPLLSSSHHKSRLLKAHSNCSIRRQCDVHKPTQGKDCEVCEEGACASIIVVS